jgi:hypothetical protein
MCSLGMDYACTLLDKQARVGESPQCSGVRGQGGEAGETPIAYCVSLAGVCSMKLRSEALHLFHPGIHCFSWA